MTPSLLSLLSPFGNWLVMPDGDGFVCKVWRVWPTRSKPVVARGRTIEQAVKAAVGGGR